MTDYERAARAASGDIEAFTQLYRTYDPLIRNIAGGIVRDRRVVEEASSEVWYWLALGRWRLTPDATPPDGTLYGFIATIARHAAIKVQYRPTYIYRQKTDDDGRILHRLHAPTPDPERRLLRREVRQRIRELIGQLPPQYRAVAIARYLDELTCPEIAERVGVKAATIPSYLHNIREKFRAALADLVYIRPKGTRQSRGGYVRMEDQRARHARRRQEQQA